MVESSRGVILAMRKYFEIITDPRQAWKVEHNLTEIIVMTICAVISGCEYWDDIVDFCKVKQEWYKEKLGLKLEKGLASHDTFQRVFQLIRPEELEASFVLWVKSVVRKTDGEIVSIDGKTVCGSRDAKARAIHMVNAWANANQLVLGQVKTDEKSNEITAIPTLLEMLELTGCIVTIDAMGCQKVIAKHISDAGADYVFGLKANQPDLLADAKLYFDECGPQAKIVTHDKGHGRIETREYLLEADIGWMHQKPDWAGLRGIGMVKSSVTEKGVARHETRYFITSLNCVEKFAKAVRAHWGVENSLHWCLDVTFGEDACRTSKDNSAENFSVIRRIALNVLKLFPVKISLARKRRKCQYDADFMADVLLSVF